MGKSEDWVTEEGGGEVEEGAVKQLLKAGQERFRGCVHSGRLGEKGPFKVGTLPVLHFRQLEIDASYT